MEDHDGCTAYNSAMLWIPISLAGLATFITIVLSMLLRRRRLCLNCCFGAPGLLSPVDYLSSQPSCFLLVMALTGLSCHTLLIIVIRPVALEVGTSRESMIDVSNVLSVAIRFVWAFLLTLLYLPLLACATKPHRLLGLLTGVLYSSLLLGYVCSWGAAFHTGCVIGMYNPSPPSSVQSAIVLVGILPIYISLVAVLLWYISGIIKWARKGRRHVFVQEHTTVHTSCYKYVKSLFKYDSLGAISNSGAHAKLGITTAQKPLTSKLQRLYSSHKTFPYPLKVTVAIVGGVSTIYELTLLAIYQFLGLNDSLNDQLDNLQDIINNTDSNSSISTTITAVLNNREAILIALNSVLITGPILALLLCIVQAFFILKRVRFHLLKAYRGDYSFVPKKITASPAVMITSSMKYPGFQIAYLIWAWFLYVIVVWTVVLLIVTLVIVIALSTNSIISLIPISIIAGSINGTIQLVQIIAPKRIFISKDSKGVVITNRRLLHLFSYIAHTWNGFPGVLSAAMRSVISLGAGLIIAPHMDMLLLPTGSESFDRGHVTYLRFIYMEALCNNHIAHVFVDLIYNSIKTCHTTPVVVHREKTAPTTENAFTDSNVLSPIHQERDNHTNKAINRWHIAYILLKNPSLQKLRKHRLLKIHSNVDNGCTDH